jgi:hypothetical protein
MSNQEFDTEILSIQMFRSPQPRSVRCVSGNFDGAVGWYTTTVKLDLEARGVIQRIPKSSPQRLRMAQ